MKKIRLILTVVFITALIGACTMVPWDEIVSLNINPTLIKKTPKVYPGGNADCATINIPGLVQTTGRNNYVPSTDSFENGWPSGLLVKVDNGRSVSFQIDGAINLGDGKCYKVGAVIVKGSDASNVYDYTDTAGVTMDKGLVPPNNASGSPAGLSNLTFCFIECQEKPVVVAVKCIYWPGPDYIVFPGNPGDLALAASSGTFIFADKSPEWCGILGINYYPETNTFPLLREPSDFYPGVRENIGTVTVWDEMGVLKVKVDIKEGGILSKTWCYVGDYATLYGTGSCPDYSVTPWQVYDLDTQTVTFTFPY